VISCTVSLDQAWALSRMDPEATAWIFATAYHIGLNVASPVKIQNNVHNKGIVADTKQVLVSSQNWSTDGTLYNRDAGLIIDHAGAAAYFEKIFLHDWDHLAHQRPSGD
jgi:phosphatidylserine/phosphatidylglycerophosphate/cardiolipin synthase-like enzyme